VGHITVLRLDGPNIDPMKGMSRAECDALCHDLAHAGVQVRHIEEPSPGVFRIVYHSTRLRVDILITNARLFRETFTHALGTPASTP
jgi:hypothetical protein